MLNTISFHNTVSVYILLVIIVFRIFNSTIVLYLWVFTILLNFKCRWSFVTALFSAWQTQIIWAIVRIAQKIYQR